MSVLRSAFAATCGATMLLGLLALPAMASPANGVWRTASGGSIEVYDCGSALCAKITADGANTSGGARHDGHNKVEALRARPIVGIEIMTGFSGGPERWTGGKIYNPEDGGTYSGSLHLSSPSSLEVIGCVVVPVCKKQVWSRLK